MDAVKAIFSRRSIRKYNEKPLDKSQIDTLLAAACSAPSAHNGRPWEFIVVQNKATINALSKVKKYYKKPLAEAPLAIAVLINPDASDKERLKYMYQDCAAAMQNMLIAATALGLGSCWMGGLLDEGEMRAVREILVIPEPKIFFGLASFGHPGEEKETRGKIEAEKIHYERY